jgi:hypothetical protein
MFAAAIIAPATAEEAGGYHAIIADAQAAYAAEDWRAFLSHLENAQALRPYSLSLTRNRILAHCLLGEQDKALEIVATIASRGLAISLGRHAALEALAAQPEFAPLQARMESNLAPVGEAGGFQEHPREDLLPESIAHDARRKSAYVGAVRTGEILALSGASGAAVFAAAPGGVYALEVSGDRLWAAVNPAKPFVGDAAGETRAGLYEYRLPDGALMEAHHVEDGPATPGALAETPAGVVVSDSGAPRLFIMRKNREGLEILSTDSRFANLQGVAYDTSRKKLFVADYLVGLFSIDLASGAATLLANDADAHLGGIDGLRAYKGALIGIQNGITPQRIVRIGLDRKGERIVKLSVLQQNLAEWNEPTNGAIVGASLVYIGTSNWPAYDGDGSAKDGARLEPLRVMELRLK